MPTEKVQESAKQLQLIWAYAQHTHSRVSPSDACLIRASMWASRALLVHRTSVFSSSSVSASWHAISHALACAAPPSSSQAHCLLQYRCVVYNKITKNKLLLTKTRDSSYENFMDDEKKMNLLKRIIKLLLKQPEKKMLYRYMMRRGGYVGLVKPQKMGHILDKYPRIIRIYRNPNELDVWVTLSKQIMELLEEEKKLKEERAQMGAERLRKVLMMSATRRIRLDRINYLKEELGLPDNFKRTVIKANPHLFKLVITRLNLEKGVSPSVKLLDWDEKLAVPAIEAYRQDPASTSVLDEEAKKKKAYSFPINLPPGFKIKKAFRHKLRKWQELPYRSPYEDTSDLDLKSEEALKRAVAVIHEFLHITVEKRTRIDRLAHLRVDYKLPQKLGATVLQNPGIFYMSTKSNTQTIFLREGYKKGQLLDKDPLLSIKEKFMALIRMGRGSVKTTKKVPYAISDSDTSDEETETGAMSKTVKIADLKGIERSENLSMDEQEEEEGVDNDVDDEVGQESNFSDDEDGQESNFSDDEDGQESNISDNEDGQQSSVSEDEDEACVSEVLNEDKEDPDPGNEVDKNGSEEDEDEWIHNKGSPDADEDENAIIFNQGGSGKNDKALTFNDKKRSSVKDPFETEDDTEECSGQGVKVNDHHIRRGDHVAGHTHGQAKARRGYRGNTSRSRGRR